MKRNPEKPLAALVVSTGISSVVSQLLIIREYLTQFQGNEYVIALIFFAWLLLGGLGSYLSALVSNRYVTADIGRLAEFSLVTALLPVYTLLLIRLGRDAAFTYGASTGFYQTIGFIFTTLAPYGLLIGFILPHTLAVLRACHHPAYPGTRVYLFDNIGDCAGGALFAFVLIYWCTPLQAVAFSAGILVLVAGVLAWQSGTASRTAWAGLFVTVLLISAGLLGEMTSLQPAGGRMAWYQESRFGRVTVVQEQEQATIFYDGVPLTSNLDLAAAEAAIHYPLSQTRGRAAVLLISAGGGMLRELAKHRPLSVDYVELNPVVAEAQFRFNLLKKIENLRVLRQDGRAYLAAAAKRYDAIIINISDPQTFQANRYYTDAFYRLAKKRLKKAGILSFSVEGYANYLSEPRQRFVSVLYRTVQPHFKHVVLLPGQRIFFLCSDAPLDTDIPDRLARKKIPTDYVAGYYYGNVTEDRLAGLARQLLPNVPVNRDSNPYLMRLMFTRWFDKFATSPRWLYLVIGILAGLLPGALLGQRLRARAIAAIRWTDSLLIVLCGLLALMILPEQAQPPRGALLLFGFAVAVLCGCQFPLALESGGEDQARIARAFTADLIGAACGALLVSVLLIPYLGLTGTLLVLIGLKVSSLVVVGLRPARGD